MFTVVKTEDETLRKLGYHYLVINNNYYETIAAFVDQTDANVYAKWLNGTYNEPLE